MTDEATVFVPGHVTGFFTVHRDDDPTASGSQGAGVTLADGVSVTVERADDRRVELNGQPASVDAVETVLDTLDVEAAVVAETDLPIGSGFGISGAMALGTALATNCVYERALSRNELVTIAHGADVQAGTGLGDVVAQAAGGMPIRLEPGGPHHNEIDAVPYRPRVEYVTFGELDTGDVIGGDTELLSKAGKEALSRLVSEPTPSQFAYASRRFARESGLLTDRLREVIQDVSEAGGEASMAMLGETVFALGSGLSDAGYDPDACRVDAAGARLI
ncbi:pantoate kinase [Halapricum hydrolyticum]|uniref:Pantoate kinase n=1 Tax=Halapricum hydrolyticum TaxID=2979991 RepID=A0AAE3IC75_9EURY|nr:pantoate kinase [Halapricum hydrolyticum]MCU4719016.1 pantoate kinase [Halapricum hydrolyticum]MCU4727945.1 pantoate kinase [Halapricum hydrolyticum]